MNWTASKQGFRSGTSKGKVSWVQVLLNFVCSMMGLAGYQTWIPAGRHTLDHARAVTEVQEAGLVLLAIAVLLILSLRSSVSERNKAIVPAALSCATAASVFWLCFPKL